MTRRLTESRLVIATHNQGKLEEIAQLLSPYAVEIVSAAALGLPEPPEIETTFLGNARIKAQAAARASGLPALADDSGIEVEALGGAPGVHTADWAETAHGRNFTQAMTRTWKALEAERAEHPRRAQFRCVLVLAWPDGHDEVFEGTIAGRCVWPVRGFIGHGYDPMFEPDGYDQTFGEMDRWAKNALSHRGAAMRKFVAACLD